MSTVGEAHGKPNAEAAKPMSKQGGLEGWMECPPPAARSSGVPAGSEISRFWVSLVLSPTHRPHQSGPPWQAGVGAGLSPVGAW